METKITIIHQQIVLSSRYEDFTSNLEQTLNRLDPGYASDVLHSPGMLRAYLESIQEPTGLLIFNIQHHGDLLNISGKPRKAKQYVIGNPLVAIQMTILDIRAALYAPLRMLVYEQDGKTIVEYDQPSSLFGQFHNTVVDEVANSLAASLFAAIMHCDKQQS